MFPVESKLPEIRASLAANRDIVLTAPPGSGKTTCVPPALLDAPWLAGKKIVMLEPRRIAARTCAQYISRKLGESVGGTVGYQVRLERRISSRTRLEIVTEGLLVQRILGDPELSDVGMVIFDEFHERALPCDLAFALTLEIRRALRPNLRILVMSATLDANAVAVHLGDADTIHAEGRMFPIRTEYLGDVSMVAAIARASSETTDGDILCFLPGEGEIRKASSKIEESSIGDFDILPLYGSMPKEEQDRVFEDSPRRKVILATSIAETSVTIPGVTCVIDSGLMRVPRFSPASGMTGLVTLPLTRDRAEQRRGRAGRIRPGLCYRLWAAESDASRPEKSMPEILDADLAPLVLISIAWGALRREDLPWMTPPPAAAWDQAVTLLKLLGAISASGRLTARGEQMARLPVHPRLSNMILGGGDPILAAIVEEGSKSRETDIRYVPRTPRMNKLAERLKSYAPGRQAPLLTPGASLALAYPERIAKNRGNGTFRMVSGRGAFLPADDPLAQEPYVVCCDLDDRQGDAKIFLAAPIAENEIVSLFSDRISEEPHCSWDRTNECVKAVIRRKLGAMTLGERHMPADFGDFQRLVCSALTDGIRQKGVDNLPCWTRESRQLRARIAFMAKHDSTWPAPTEDTLLAVIPDFTAHMTKWRDLEKLDIPRVFECLLAGGNHTRRELDLLAPTRMEVPSGSHVLIHYEGDEPTAEVKLQECFGLMETPKLAGGRVPVVMVLLSPAQRPIQITKDLAGFWKGAYQLIRKDMRGRYPKHYWPDDPFSATATRHTTRRPS